MLRAINVGGHVVKMEALRACFAALGHAKVETFIASGNVIFESTSTNARTLEQKIERHLQQTLGYEVATFLRTPAELAVIVAYRPFAPSEVEGSHGMYVGFLRSPPNDETRRKLLASSSSTDLFHVHGREIYWLARERMSDSPFSGAVLEKILAAPVTMRNITTVRKLAAKYPPA